MPEAARRDEQKQPAPKPSTCGQVAAANPRGSKFRPQAKVSQYWSQSLADGLLGGRHGGAADFLPCLQHIPLSTEGQLDPENRLQRNPVQ
jgi:hypothetical protein